jgi:hypothetical protein
MDALSSNTKPRVAKPKPVAVVVKKDPAKQASTTSADAKHTSTKLSESDSASAQNTVSSSTNSSVNSRVNALNISGRSSQPSIARINDYSVLFSSLVKQKNKNQKHKIYNRTTKCKHVNEICKLNFLPNFPFFKLQKIRKFDEDKIKYDEMKALESEFNENGCLF